MKRNILFLFFIGLFIYGCSCDDCGPVTSNPSVTIQFLRIDSAGSRSVIIDQLNGQPGGSFDLIGEEASTEFRFPVDLNSDTSVFTIRYFLEQDTSRINALNDTIAVSYRRNTVQTELRDVVLQIDSIALIEDMTSYDSITVNCLTPLCFQTETTINAFF